MNGNQPDPNAAAPGPAAGKNVPLLGRDLSPGGFARALVLLALLGVLIRVGFFLEHAHSVSFGVPTLDQKYYDTTARMLVAGEDLRELHGFRPLLYPLFLAGFYWLGGSAGVDLALFAQHLLGVVTGLLVAVIAARLFCHRWSGIAAGALYLLAPVPLYLEGELLIEPSYTFLITLGLWLHLRAASAAGASALRWWLIGGGLTVLTAQARANILVFLAIYPVFAAWFWWRERNRAALAPLGGLVGALAMMVVWGAVNARQSGHFHLLPNQGGVNLYLGNKRTADGMIPEQDRRIVYGERYQDSVEVWAREEYEQSERAQGRQPSTDPMAISHYWTQRTIAEIKAAPGSWLRLLAKKTWLSFWNAEVPNNKTFAFLQEEFAWLRWLPVRWVVLLTLLPAGLWAAMKWGARDAWVVLALYAALYSAGNIAFFICDRYRYPVIPAAAAFASGGLLLLVTAWRERRNPLLVGIAASALLMALISLPNWFGAKLPTFARDYHFRSLAYYNKGRFAEALADIDRSVALDRSDATALHHRGNVLFALNRFDEARLVYEETLRSTPEDPAVWNNLGAVYEALARPEDARLAYRRATQCRPPSLNAYLGLALLDLQAGRVEDAAAGLAQLEALPRGRSAASLALRSVIARRQGKAAEADALEAQARSSDAASAAWAIERAAGSKPAR